MANVNIGPTFGGFDLERVLREEKQRSEKPVQPRSSPQTGIEYEEKAHRIPTDPLKPQSFTYPISLYRLREHNWERHARPIEMFSMLMTDGHLSRNENAAYRDWAKSRGEWLSAGMERWGSKLQISLDPEGVDYQNAFGKYAKGKDFFCKEFLNIDLARVPDTELLSLNNFPNNFVRYITGRKYEDIPRYFRMGAGTIFVSLPRDGEYCPISVMHTETYIALRGNPVNNIFNASRGVRFR